MEHSEKYKEGYETGLAWKHDWTPGGPYVHRVKYNRTPERVAEEAASIKANTDWLQGWKDGVKAQGEKQ